MNIEENKCFQDFHLKFPKRQLRIQQVYLLFNWQYIHPLPSLRFYIFPQYYRLKNNYIPRAGIKYNNTNYFLFYYRCAGSCKSIIFYLYLIYIVLNTLDLNSKLWQNNHKKITHNVLRRRHIFIPRLFIIHTIYTNFLSMVQVPLII